MIKKKNPPTTFGSYIRSLRIDSGIGQRELAKKIDISPSYLNDLEKNKRNAPKVELINKFSVLLKADLELLYNLAGNSNKSIPPDLSEYIDNNPKIISLIRSLKNRNFNDDEIDTLIKNTDQSKTKALIVAAGL